MTGRAWTLTLAVAGLAIGAVAFMVWRQSHLHPPPPAPPPMPHFATQVARGEWLFRNTGCPTCHGVAARGGIVNANYIAGTVPTLDVLADQMGLGGPEDAQAVIAIVEHGQDPAIVPATPPFPGYADFAARWHDTRDVIENGSVAAKADPAGPAPPLQMPAWRATLTPDAINAVLAYLLSLQDWN